MLLITAYATVENAVEAFQRGAHDYLMKPILLDEVLEQDAAAAGPSRPVPGKPVAAARTEPRSRRRTHIVGRSPAMRQVFELVRKVAPTRSTVLITGESGTGKELIARAIHDVRGRRAARARFLAVNCAAIPHDLLENQLFGHRKGAFTGADRDQAGVFVHAGRGTVFLDEIGEMPLATQAKLLRAIEQKEMLPVGANEPVRGRGARAGGDEQGPAARRSRPGRFREDLYYRLNVVTHSPAAAARAARGHPRPGRFPAGQARPDAGQAHPRRDARGDAAACWRAAGRATSRELDNALQRAVILGEGPLVTPADLPPDLAPVEGRPGRWWTISARR